MQQVPRICKYFKSVRRLRNREGCGTQQEQQNRLKDVAMASGFELKVDRCSYYNPSSEAKEQRTSKDCPTRRSRNGLAPGQACRNSE
jgi:hypothetical protein